MNALEFNTDSLVADNTSIADFDVENLAVGLGEYPALNLGVRLLLNSTHKEIVDDIDVAGDLQQKTSDEKLSQFLTPDLAETSLNL